MVTRGKRGQNRNSGEISMNLTDQSERLGVISPIDWLDYRTDQGIADGYSAELRHRLFMKNVFCATALPFFCDHPAVDQFIQDSQLDRPAQF